MGFFLFYIIATLIVSATYVVGQILAGEIGQAAYQFDTGAIIRFLLLLTGVMAARAVFSALAALFVMRYVGSVEYSFRVNFAKFFLRQPFAKFEKTNSGENLSVFTNDLPQAVNLVSNGVLGIVSDFMLLVVTIAYMLYVNWFYTLIFLIAFPVIVLLQAVISKPIESAQMRVNESSAAYNSVVNDSLQNVSTIIAYNLEDELEKRYMTEYKRFFADAINVTRLFCIFKMGGEAITAAPLVYLFIASGFAVLNEAMLISEFIVFTGIGMFAAGSLGDLADAVGNLRMSMAGAVRLNNLTTGDAENLGDAHSLTINSKIAVAFENISFAYAEDAPNVLHDLSFEIPHGAKVAIVGGSGSGKSTILKLLLGLYEPKNGKINILGNDTAGIGKYTLRTSFAYVPQDSFMFPVSISENITGKNRISTAEQAKLENACHDAGILDFINGLPNKFASMLSESAENISGGQRQRIAMARAFYKDAPIILFDEATSALDPTTEAEILRTLKEATKDKTVIMVAHRAAAKDFCDTIITMKGGKIV